MKTFRYNFYLIHYHRLEIIYLHYCWLLKVLLPAANILQLDYVSGMCAEFLQTQLAISNCLGIKAFAELHNCTELMINSDAFIKKHFLYDQYNMVICICQQII